MARNHVQPGKTMTFVNGTGALIKSGDPVLVGTSLGVAANDIPDGESGELFMEEVWELPTANVDVSQGAKAYFITASKQMTNVSTGNTLVGTFWADGAAADEVVPVKINTKNA
tara:strand:- start:323 stop:661 length:339 start_codon:yes stop_codon:yes gene_type:complete